MRILLDGKSIRELPSNYNKWSSTVIFFLEDSDSVHAFAKDTAASRINNTYFIVSYKRQPFLTRRLARVGYTAGDRKLYFVGDAKLDEDGDLFYPLEIKVYDIPNRKWMDNNIFPNLKAPMPNPIVFFIHHCLYVISIHSPLPRWPHFEMLNMNHLSKGWVSLPQPSFVWHPAVAFDRNLIMDYSKETLYIKLFDRYIVHGFSFKDQTWYMYTNEKPLTPLTRHLSGKYQWNDCVIVENHLYTFQNYKSQVVLIIRDLEPVPDDDFDEGRIICEVDISNTVHRDVVKDKHALGSLLYLGKKESCRRFFLAILYSPRNQRPVVSTCTFDLSDKFKVQNSSCQNKPLNLGPFIPLSLQCEVLCEVKDD